MSMWLLQIEILQKTTEIYEEERFFLQQELESKEQQLRRELADKRRMEQHLDSVVKDTQLKWEKECVSYYPHSRIKWGSLDFRFTSLPLRTSSHSAFFFFFLQERRVNAAILEMQRKLRLKDELLNQLRAVVMDRETGAEHQPRQKHKQEPMPEAEETLPEQKLGSSTPLHVCLVDSAAHLSMTSICSIFTLLSCISNYCKSDLVTVVDCSHKIFLLAANQIFQIHESI